MRWAAQTYHDSYQYLCTFTIYYILVTILKNNLDVFILNEYLQCVRLYKFNKYLQIKTIEIWSRQHFYPSRLQNAQPLVHGCWTKSKQKPRLSRSAGASTESVWNANRNGLTLPESNVIALMDGFWRCLQTVCSNTCNGFLHRTDFGIEGSTANAILTNIRLWQTVGNACTPNQKPIVDARIRRSLTTTTHHWIHCHIRVTGQCERPRSVEVFVGKNSGIIRLWNSDNREIFLIFTWILAGSVLNAAKISLRSYANAIVLIRQLAANSRIEIETSYTSIDSSVVL